ncbi:MAG TPA: coenzyme F420-0:L-glutamate ligase [Steroidobacteraceae bacterium]|nr:coenzyme F420-0:L-glutamate ligase [Steroidobacteraceae bacterium]
MNIACNDGDREELSATYRAVPPAELSLTAVRGFPLVRAGDDLAQLLLSRLEAASAAPGAAAAPALRDDDVLVFAQKIVSKAEGRCVRLADVVPSQRARALAAQVAKDPRLVELVLSESRRIVRAARDVLIVEHRLGFVLANAGIDQSNVASAQEGESALLLPLDPDASAERLRARLAAHSGCRLGVIISDSFGRPWRVGTVGVAIGVAGWAAVTDLRGRADLFGRTLRVTVVGHADEIAAAASLLMGQAGEGQPVVRVRGLALPPAGSDGKALLRPASEDLFR